MRQPTNLARFDDPGRAARRSRASTSTRRCRFIVLVLLAILPGCSESRARDGDSARDAAVYRAVILDVIVQSEAELDGAGDLPVLFIEALGADGIPLKVQIEVVAGFVDQFEIRFIDRRDEAIEIDLPRLPVRTGSLLIGLGPIVIDGSADVRAEIYSNTDEIQGYGYTLEDAGEGAWDVSGIPVPVEPEGLVSAP